MNPKEQRIAIAEACGLKNLRMAYVNDGSAVLICDCPEFAGQWTEVPEYLTDLNAMHEAEKILTDDQYMDLGKAIFEDDSYYGWCGRISSRDTPDEAERVRYLSLTAAQRAEAFLKTLNLWKE